MKIVKVKKNLNIFEEKSFISLSRFLLSSFIVISFFYITPMFINFAEKNFNTKEFTNNSNKILNNALNKKKLFEDDNELVQQNEIDLLYDILDQNNLDINVVRYTTSEINALFKKVNYNLEDIRDTKLVKPVPIDLMPNEIKTIKNTKKRKEMFIKIVLPLILKENNKIRIDRKRLFTILNKSNNTDIEKKWLEKKYKQYGVIYNDLSTLKIRMDEIPVSLAIAQAAKETGWGTSRFVQEGNALFGQWTWSGEGLIPKDADKNKGHKVMKFHILQLSVRAYLRNLNTHASYRDLRKARAELRDLKKPLDSIILSKHLDKYAETGNQYIDVLQKIIQQNNLKDFDEARLLPSSKDLESLI
jgi:Bax protein